MENLFGVLLLAIVGAALIYLFIRYVLLPLVKLIRQSARLR